MPSGKPTLRDVAKAAGVSPMTASNALHGKPGVKDSTRAKVLAVAEKLDYRINLTASMLKSGRSNIIHIIVNEFDSPFYSKLVESLVTETTERGLTPFVEQTRYSPDAAKHALANNPFSGQLFDGEIIHASGLNAGVPLSAINHGRPLVLIDACEETPTFDTVNFPNEDGARAAVQHLIECGCHRIAIVGDGYSLEEIITAEPPFNADVKYVPTVASNGWSAKAAAPWITKAFEKASETYWGNKPAYMGLGASIPLVKLFSEKWPHAQFMVSGALGPNSNAHGPNESLHIEYCKKQTASVAYLISQYEEH